MSSTAGARRFEADNVVVATGVMQTPWCRASRRARPADQAAPFQGLSEPGSAAGGRILVVGAATPEPTSPTSGASARDHPVGDGHGSDPGIGRTSRGRVGFRVLVLLGSHILTIDTPLGRKMRPHIRHGGAPLLRYRTKDCSAPGSSASCADGRRQTACPCSRRSRPRRPERDLVHWVSAGLLVDPGSRSRSARTATRSSTAAPSRPPRLYFVGTPLPALVHVDARRRDGKGRRAGRKAHRGPAHQSEGVCRSGRSDCRAGRLVTKPPAKADVTQNSGASSILVWNGLVTRMRRIGGG